MSAPSAPPVPRIDLGLSLTTPSGGTRTVDLATRALVIAVVPPPRWGREAEVLAGVAAAAEAGADVAEVPAEPRLLGPAAATGGLPVVARADSAQAARAALSAGAALVLVPVGRLDGALARDGEASTSAPSNGDTSQWVVARAGAPPDLAASNQVVPLVDSARAGRDAVAAQANLRPGSHRPPGIDPGPPPARPVALDIANVSGADAVSEESLALAVGVRLIRTADVRRTRRVVEVMAHLLEARR